MNLDSSKDPSDLETAYNQLKTSLYLKFTQFMIFIMIVTSIIELGRAIFLAQLSIMINPIGSIALAIFLSRFKEKKLFIMTVFNMITYAISLYGHYSGTGYFNNPCDTFYFAYTFAFLERLLVDRIPTATERTFAGLGAMLLRLLIVPLNDKGLLVIQSVILMSMIYFDFNQEKHYKQLFNSHFHSKDQLEKFKDLVENNIPEGIIVVSRDSMQSLFVNRAFKSLFETTTTLDIRAQLNSFCRRELLGASVTSVTSSTNDSDQTLLDLLNRMGNEGERKYLSNQSEDHFGLPKNTLEKDENIFEVKILDIVWDEVPAFAIVLHDITQQQTILQLKIAADLNKDKVLATVSHELRTPLNGILGMIQIMAKKIQDADLLQYLKICQNSANLLIGLVNSILDLNQIRANKLKLCHDKVYLYELLKDIVYLFEFQCMQKKIALKLQVSPRIPKIIITDKNRLNQIFINLVGNALKFTINGSITITAREAAHPDMIQFSIEDTGMGIKEEDKAKLFMMYGRLDQDDHKINQQGVGLGLTISNNLAQLLCDDEKLGGIKVDSEYRKGSAFTFLISKNLSDELSSPLSNLQYDVQETYQSMTDSFFEEFKNIDLKLMHYRTQPVKQNPGTIKITSSPTSPRNLVEKNIKNARHKRDYSLNSPFLIDNRIKSSPALVLKNISPTILIVDDNPFNITVASHLVSCQGFNVKSALYGQTAIEIALDNDYKTEPIKLILMDCQMPLMDGYETTKNLKRFMREGKIPEIPIVALTANNSVEDREACKKAGMCDYLTKPLTEANLIKILKKHSC